MATYILSDVHGRVDNALDVIEAAGVTNEDFVVQLGDLANCVAESFGDDMAALDLVGNVIDQMLVGNHEIPYFDPSNYFGGFRFYGEIDKKLRQLFDDGRLCSAHLHGDTLITHAGLTRAKWVNMGSPTAEGACAKIEHEWFGNNFGHSLFSDVGRRRGGPSTVGGVLWCDWNEMEPVGFPQIVGHTTGRNIRIKGNVTCIDAQGDIRAEHRTPSIVRLEDTR